MINELILINDGVRSLQCRRSVTVRRKAVKVSEEFTLHDKLRERTQRGTCNVRDNRK